MRAEIHLPNADEKLRPGMYVQVALTFGAATSSGEATPTPRK
jgi:hypothetical protein